MSTLVTSQLYFCFSKTMNGIFGTLELRSFNLFLFYLTSVVFSMYWKSRRRKCSGLFSFTIWIKRQSKIAREVNYVCSYGWWQDNGLALAKQLCKVSIAMNLCFSLELKITTDYSILVSKRPLFSSFFFLFVGSRALILVQRRPPYSKQRGN